MTEVAINSQLFLNYIQGAVRHLIAATMIEDRISKSDAISKVEGQIVDLLRKEGLRILGSADINLIEDASRQVFKGSSLKIVEEIFNSIKEYAHEEASS